MRGARLTSGRPTHVIIVPPHVLSAVWKVLVKPAVEGAAGAIGGRTAIKVAGGRGGYKECPDCREQDIKAGARVCKHCGYRFDADKPPSGQ
jgi:hypothetical protein